MSRGDKSSAGDTLCYQFQLNNFNLNITESTIRALNNFVIKSGFNDIELRDVAKVMGGLSRDGLLTKVAYDRGIERLLVSSDISEVDKVGCSMTLSSIFYTFDRTDSDVVDVIDLVCGLAVICEGSKSTKLAFAFDLMDEDKDGVLSKRGLWRYFRAFLCVLLTVSGASLDMSSGDLASVCDDCAVWTSANLLQSLPNNGSTRGCSFENLADWYTKGGYRVATWLELLDLSKWLPLRDLGDSLSDPPARPTLSSQASDSWTGNGVANDSENVPENPFVEDDGTEIFRSDLPNGHSLTLMESDSNFVLQISQLTGFYNLTPQVLLQRLQEYCVYDGVISISGYNNFVSSSAPKDLNDDELARVSFALSSIYYSYDDDGQNQALLISLASGLAVLCKGSKSSKLSACFHLFDSNGDGLLSTDELALFLGSFLRMLLACSFSTASSREYGKTSEIVNNTCQLLAHNISNGALIDFQTFGDWYNDGGFRIIPWIELIDLSKWVKISAVSASNVAEASANDRKRTSLPMHRRMHSNIIHSPERPEEDEEDDATFTLMLYRRNAQHVVSISAATVREVSALSTRLRALEPERIVHAIVSSCGKDGLLSRKDFDRLIQRIHPERRKQYYADVEARVSRGGVPSSPLTDKNRDAFGSLFNAFDRTGKGVVDAIEVAIGLAVLCSGSKSAKLATAFDLIDEDTDGLLSRRGLWRFFRSFLCALLTLSGAAQELSPDELIRVADGTALFACDSVLTSPTTSKKDGQVAANFDDIADWYTSAGYRIAPWLELLDMSKWNQLVSN